MDVEALAEGVPQLRDIGDLGQEPQLDLRVVGGHELVAGRGDEARRILRPSSLRIGMFCRFGSDDDSRPVGVAASA